MSEIIRLLEDAEYDFALAYATQEEINAQAACGHLCLIDTDE